MTNDDTTRRTDSNGAAERQLPPDELVERLVRLADSGPTLPAGGAEQVKATIRPLWRSEVRGRSFRRLLWGAGGLAAAATVVLAISLAVRVAPPAPAPEGPAARLAAVVGTVEILPPSGAPVHVTARGVGDDIVAGAWLRTDTASRAALELGGGQSLRLDTDTRVRLESPAIMALDRGAVYLDSQRDAGAAMEVRTAFGVARDIGTQFEVRRSGDTLTVRVREGVVSLTRDGELYELSQGTALTVASSGSRQTSTIRSYGPEWGWTQEVAPPFAIEGRSVVAFLDWVSRETGLWVHFADPAAERFAGTTVLHGTIEGLAPAQAPDVVLPGCGLKHRISGGTLIVEQPPGDGTDG